MRYFRLIVFLALLAPLQARTLPGNAHLLQQVTFPEVTLTRATLNEAIDLLRNATREIDPDGAGINIVIPPETEAAARPLTLSLRNVAGPDLLRVILDLTNLRLQVRGNLLWILPPE